MKDGDYIVKKWQDMNALERNIKYSISLETIGFLKILDCCYVNYESSALRDSAMCVVLSKN